MRFIRCKNCGRSGKTAVIPDNCPICGYAGEESEEAEDKNLLATIWNALTGKNKRLWYYNCDQLGFVKGDQIPWPADTLIRY